MITLTVNGAEHALDLAPDTDLLTALRDDLHLTGSRYGCGHGACGACSVLIDGVPRPACVIPVADVAGHRVTTIEGLAEGEALHPVQQAFIDEDAMQCGYCTSGMIIGAVALLAHNPRPSDGEVRAALAGHLCRCGIYHRVRRAVQRAVRRASDGTAP